MKNALSPEILRSIPQFFIVGMGRSGTTLLKTICDTHPQVICPPESKIFLSLSRNFQKKKLQLRDVPFILEHLRLDRKIETHWNLDFAQLEQDLKTCIGAGGGFNEVCKVIYLNYPSQGEKSTIRLIGDKNPGYAVNLDWINHTFPGSKYIHIIRDYRDCIASHNRVFKKRPVRILATAWNLTNQRIEKLKRDIPQQFITVRYEDLTNNTGEEIQRICAFLGIEFTESMMKFYQVEAQPKDASYTAAFQEMHGDLMKPVHNQNIGKYKKSLNQNEISLIEWISEHDGRKYGYEPEKPTKKKFFYPLQLLLGKIRFFRTNTTINLYYRSPFFVKKMMRRFYDFLFRKFGFSSRYNNAEMMYKRKTAKTVE